MFMLTHKRVIDDCLFGRHCSHQLHFFISVNSLDSYFLLSFVSFPVLSIFLSRLCCLFCVIFLAVTSVPSLLSNFVFPSCHFFVSFFTVIFVSTRVDILSRLCCLFFCLAFAVNLYITGRLYHSMLYSPHPITNSSNRKLLSNTVLSNAAFYRPCFFTGTISFKHYSLQSLFLNKCFFFQTSLFL